MIVSSRRSRALPRVRSSSNALHEQPTRRLSSLLSHFRPTAPIMAPASAPAPLQKINNHEQYLTDGIPSASSLLPSPIAQFSAWFSEAQESIPEPEAFALSTVSEQGIPSTRVVLLKRVDERGFVFFTNYESRKGMELFGKNGDKSGYASMAFYWRDQHRSVRVVGRAEKVSEEETKEYFEGRPVGSRVGAWASKQSTVLTGREELEDNVKAIEERFGVKGDASAVDVGPAGTKGSDEAEIPVPPFWGGVRIVPFEVEFWMGRESRLHDRMRYTRAEGSEGEWEIGRLSP